MDEDTTTDRIQLLNEGILAEVLRHPRGTKRTRRIAEALEVSVHHLRTIAEVFNPGCFQRAARKHGLTPGLSFDISLGTDLLQTSQRQHVREYIRTVRPGLVLMAPPCQMFSQLQNLLRDLRQRDPACMARYLRKKREATLLFNFAVELAWTCLELGLDFVIEHPWASGAWKTPAVTRLLQDDRVVLSRTDQCQFGLRGPTGQHHRKRTGFCTNNAAIGHALERLCQDDHEHDHIIGGSKSRRSQVYPEALKSTIIRTYARGIQGDVHQRTSVEILQQDLAIEQWWSAAIADDAYEHFAAGVGGDADESAAADDGAAPVDAADGAGGDLGLRELDDRRGPLLPDQRIVRLRHLVKRAHEGLGHPHKDRFLRILKLSKASDEVLRLARELQCTACDRNQMVRPPRRAAPPREIGVNEVVGIDLVWIPRWDGSLQPALNLLDWGTHFQMVIPIARKKPELVREAYRHWLRFFGPPATLASDLGREFEGSFSVRAETDGTFVDPSSVESPYQRGMTERAGKTFKMMLSKAMETYVCSSEMEWRELVDVVNMQKNRLLLKSGYSPIQRVIGYAPRIPGGLLTGGADNRSQPEHVRIGDEGARKSMEMRKAASLAFHEADCSEAFRRAISAGPGDL